MSEANAAFRFSVGDTVRFSFNNGTFKVTKRFTGALEAGGTGLLYTIQNAMTEFELVEEAELSPVGDV